MDFSKKFQELCTPAKIYFVIALVGCFMLVLNRVSVSITLSKLMFALIWTYILSWLCGKGYKSVSWFLVLFPYVMILLGVVFVSVRL